MTKVDVGGIVHAILEGGHTESPFTEIISALATAYATDTRVFQPLGKRCAECEFRTDAAEDGGGLHSGFHECWKALAGFTPADFLRPSILDIWEFRKKEEYIQKKIYFQDQISLQDLSPASTGKKRLQPATGLTRTDRQLIQVEKNKNNDNSYYFDKKGMKSVMEACSYPLHFIDFETSAVAIPFNKGRRPYEQVAFQFSHHIIEANGQLSHAGQWINTVPGKFPNFDFIRALKGQLEKDGGTIFRYANHENSILNAVYEQLQTAGPADEKELCSFIRTISHSKTGAAKLWKGERDMVDMLEWVKLFYYSPSTNGSNSIKKVLPAILNDSQFLQNKYRLPIYGEEIPSLNFRAHAWIQYDENHKIINPYYTLPSIQQGYDNESLDNLLSDEDGSIADGGAAMTAYASMQFTEMPDQERERIKDALLRYCELDTMAMVMLWEGWSNWCN